MPAKRNVPAYGSRSTGAADLARKLGIFSAGEFTRRGFPRTYLQRMVRKGEIVGIARGLYVHVKHEGGETQTLVEVGKRVPAGVVCLISALVYHGVGTQSPHVVWVALPRGQRKPQVAGLPVRTCLFSRKSHAAGIEEHHFSGGTVRVYSVAKTIADCFKYRNRIGLDVCIEALRSALAARKANLTDIQRYAKVCRVDKVIRPYLEALQ